MQENIRVNLPTFNSVVPTNLRELFSYDCRCRTVGQRNFRKLTFQDSEKMCFRCHFIANLLLNVAIKIFKQSVNN